MFTFSLTYERTFFSTMAGGGVRGKGDGIVRSTIIPVGFTIRTFPLSIQESLQTGGTTTGIAAGIVINGTINEYLKNSFKIIGEAGKGISTGKSRTPGVSRDCDPSLNPRRPHLIER